jgi:hypothetical protein
MEVSQKLSDTSRIDKLEKKFEGTPSKKKQNKLSTPLYEF